MALCEVKLAASNELAIIHAHSTPSVSLHSLQNPEMESLLTVSSWLLDKARLESALELTKSLVPSAASTTSAVPSLTALTISATQIPSFQNKALLQSCLNY
jgi:hypothetical protein